MTLLGSVSDSAHFTWPGPLFIPRFVVVLVSKTCHFLGPLVSAQVSYKPGSMMIEGRPLDSLVCMGKLLQYSAVEEAAALGSGLSS